MAEKTKTDQEDIPRATARGSNLNISFKHSVNIGRALRGRDVAYCVRYLVDTINRKRAIPSKKYGRDTSHKPGISGGRYPNKASLEILRLINSAIGNAKSNHMDVGLLYISKFECGRAISKNRASRRGIGRLTNIMIEMREREGPETKPESEKKEKKPKKTKPKKKKPKKKEKPAKKKKKAAKKPKKAKKAKPKKKKPKKKEAKG